MSDVTTISINTVNMALVPKNQDGLQGPCVDADLVVMEPVIQLFVGVNPVLYYGQSLLVAGTVLSLYLMRRRVRLGRRQPTF